MCSGCRKLHSSIAKAKHALPLPLTGLRLWRSQNNLCPLPSPPKKLHCSALPVRSAATTTAQCSNYCSSIHKNYLATKLINPRCTNNVINYLLNNLVQHKRQNIPPLTPPPLLPSHYGKLSLSLLVITGPSNHAPGIVEVSSGCCWSQISSISSFLHVLDLFCGCILHDHFQLIESALLFPHKDSYDLQQTRRILY